MKFTLTIELGNDAMQRSDGVRRALKELRRHLGDTWVRGQLLNREDGEDIRDVNSVIIGKWEITS